MRPASCSLGFSLSFLVLSLFVNFAWSATLTVTNQADNGAGSLRQRIAVAAAGDTINFTAALNGRTIVLTSGELLIAKSLNLAGPGATNLAVSGNGNSRIFFIRTNVTCTIADLAMINGNGIGSNSASGGAIYNAGNLTLSNATVSGNSAGTFGGGIYNEGVDAFGGGPTNGARLTVKNCTLSGNSAGSGGGIYSGDTAELTAINCTFSTNSASIIGALIGGGAINNSFGQLTLNSCTFSGNSSSSPGGAIGNLGPTATLTIDHTLLAKGASGGNFANKNGAVINRGFNLADDTSAAAFASNAVNLLLGPLADNGGPTATHALLPGSPAINAGINAALIGLPADQRGFLRFVDGRMDIGSYEAETTMPTLLCPPDLTRTNTYLQNYASNVSFAIRTTGVPAPAVVCLLNGTTIASPYSFQLGTNLVTCAASNAVGVAAGCSFTVTVLTNIEPVLWFSVLAGIKGGRGNADGPGSDARFHSPSAIAIDAAGNAFVADSYNQTIRKVTTNGIVTTLAGQVDVAGSADGTGNVAHFNQPLGIVLDGAGNAIIADSYNHTIRKMTPDGVVTTFAGQAGTSGTANGTGGAARFNYPIGLALDVAGNLFVAEYGNHAIRRVTPAGVVTTFAGLPGTPGTTDAAGTAARFRNPWGISVATNGIVYVGDYGNHTIRKITSAGAVTTYAGTPGTPGYLSGSSGLFFYPAGVVADATGNVFVADSGNDWVRHIFPDRSVETIVTLGAYIDTPIGIAMDAATNLYTSEAGSHTVRRIDPVVEEITTLAGLRPQPGSANGVGTLAEFDGTAGIGLDAGGNAYVADYGNSTIRKVNPLGVVTTVAGAAGQTNSYDGPATVARFNHPNDVAVDSSGNVYVADSWNHTIRKMTPDGMVTTLAGMAGSPGTNNGTGSAARFNYPWSVAVDLSGNVYVADYSNHAIRKISPAGAVTTLAGLPGTSGTANGIGTVARFNNPEGVAVDASGNVYVADTWNFTIRKITPAGVVSTLAGLAGSGGSADGDGAQARFGGASDLAVDAAGFLYVADTVSATVRKVSPTGTVITLGGAPRNTTVLDGEGTAARMNYPDGIAVHSSGRVYVSSFDENVVMVGLPANEVPFLFTQPSSLTCQEGFTASFTAEAAGALPIAYQWSIDGVPIPNATNAAFTVSSVALSSAGTYTVVASNAFGLATSTNAVLTVIPGVPLPEALDAPTQAWRTGGDGIWLGQSADAHDATDAAQSVPVGAAQEAWLETTVQGSGTVAFWWKSSGPSGAATLTLLLNGLAYVGISGETGWQLRTVALSGGTNILRWRFSSTTGAGYGAVDQFTFTQSPFVTTHPQSLSTLPGSNAFFSVNAIGPGMLSYQWQKDGANLAGATRSTYTVTNVQAVDAGWYRVLVANAFGMTTSSNALLAVLHTQAMQFVRSGTITIPESGPATPYPSTLSVSGFPGSLSGLEVTLSNFTHSYAADVDILLQGPGGQKVMLMSDVGWDVANVVLRFADSASQPLFDGQFVSGTYLPTDLYPNDTLPSTARPYDDHLSAFNGSSPNGTWSLYVYDDASTYGGSLASWSLKLYQAAAAAITQQPQSLIVSAGQPAAFEVTASTSLPLSYQWRKNGDPIGGATNRSYPISSARIHDAGGYSVVLSNAAGAITSSVARLVVVNEAGIPVAFADDFEANTSGAWLVFPGFTNGVADFTATFAYDYSGFFSSFNNTNIPSAPNSSAGTTRGLRVAVNKNDAIAATAAVSLYPRGQDFTGACALKFDLWMNYPGTNGGAGAVGATENALFGLNHAGTRVNWDAATSTPSDGVWFTLTGQGGFTNDYRAYVGNTAGRPSLLSFASSGIAASGATGPNNGDSYFTNLFPVTTYETPGAPGKRWVQVEVSQNASNVLTWRINGSLVARRMNTSSFTNGNVMVGCMDLEPNIASPATNAFVLFDNVRVEFEPQALLPVFTSQPTNLSVIAGQSATFASTVSGLGPLQYGWRKNGMPIVGATNASLTLTNAQPEDAGLFSLLVSNVLGAVVSSNAVLTVIVLPPTIVVPPENQSVVPGSQAAFQVVATGAPPPSGYQWLFNGTPLPGATQSSYTVASAAPADAGGYRIIVTNSVGSVTSAVAFLTVQTPPPLSLPPPHLVKDINQAPVPVSSSPAEIVQVGTNAFFAATDAVHGRELWKTDGTSAGTVLVKDILSGPGSSDPRQLLNVNGTLYFGANDGTNGVELWKSDGTAAGTVLIKDIWPGTAASSPADLLKANGAFYFTANDGTNGIELWKSDGTSAGTVMVTDIYPGTNGSSLFGLTAFNSALFFTANNGTNGLELWKSDGTSAGTVMVKDILPAGTGYPFGLTVFKSALYFTANDGTNGYELWKSDGTAAGTVMVKDINPGSDESGINSSYPSQLTVCNNLLFFEAETAAGGSELWKSDGTSAGTVLVKDIWVGGSGSLPYRLVAVGNVLFFTADNGTTGRELWKSDGTTAGTFLVKDIYPGTDDENGFPNDSDLDELTAYNNALYFRANNGTNGYELWKSDGTTAGTVMVRDIVTGNGSSSPAGLANINGTLFFSAFSATNGYELWKCDGSTAGTTLVRNINEEVATSSASPRNLVRVGQTLFFSANDGLTGTELWQSDGSGPGTVLVKDIANGAASANPQYLFDAGGTLLFAANAGTNGTELWRSDGTPAGTLLVRDIAPGTNDYGAFNSSNPSGFANILGSVLFRAYDPSVGYELWRTDGTTAGTRLLKDPRGGAGPFSPDFITGLNGAALFTAFDYDHGYELWRSDGTTNGTQLLRDIGDGPGSSSPYQLVRAGGTVFFRATDALHGTELWRSDGTAAGTLIVRDIGPGSASGNPLGLADVNGTLFFTAYDPTTGTELWKSDGTEAGTRIVKDIVPGVADSYPSSCINVNGIAYFTPYEPTTGRELWRSDGTEAGTFLVKDIWAGSQGSNPSNFINANGRLFFTANDGTNGTELWVSDGTSAGTQIVADLYPGAGASAPAYLTRVDRKLFFTAYSLIEGYELFVLPLPNQPPTDLLLASAGVAEHQPPGVEVGPLWAADNDTDESFTFSLVNGTGDADNGLFAVVGSSLRTAATLDYATKPTCRIRLQATDSSGASLQKSFTVPVLPTVLPPPAAASLSELNYSGGQFHFLVSGSFGRSYVIEVSTNLASGIWIPLATNVAPSLFTVTNPPTSASFYRAVGR